MRTENIQSDVTVVGGGLAGVCAAIAAARQGATVSLIQNRPVLGGNSSSEIRVWVCGATAHGVQMYARETGIMGELFVENQFLNAEGNPYYWDLTVLEAVRAEPNITLFLNTDVREVVADGDEADRAITSVTGWMMGSERQITFTSPTFVDATGDGLVGFLAGAHFRTGREPFADFEESWAPLVPDDNTLGSTILFYTKDVGHPVKFVPPSFALDISTTSIPDRRIINVENKGCAYWWIEWGGEHDVVHDDDLIRDELQSAVYGIWDHIKNSGRYDAENLTLEWIGSVPGKREYRRFIGDHTLTQHDVLEQTAFPDKVAFGGWSIDLHPPGGMYATEHGSKHWHPDAVYDIPLRCLFSENVQNLWLAGRNISASHVAFGSTRVMATCAVIGEAAGLAAALAARLGVTPRELAADHMPAVHRAMVRSDSSVIGLVSDDPDDLALQGTAEASSTLRHLVVDQAAGRLVLEDSIGMVLPVDPTLGTLELLLDASAETQLEIELHRTGDPRVYLPKTMIISRRVDVAAEDKQWVEVDLDWTPEHAENAFIVIRANPAIALHVADTALPGMVFFRLREAGADEEWTEQFRTWRYILDRQSICLRLREDTAVYSADHVIGGYARPYGGPQTWVSQPHVIDPEPWVAVRWPQPVTVHQVSVVLDDSLEIDLINLHHHISPHDVMPALLTHYRIEAEVAGEWRVLVDVTDNRRRRRDHHLEAAVPATAVRLVSTRPGHDAGARVIALRVY